MNRGFNNERGARFAMDGKCSKVNGSFAATVTSYRPPRAHATAAASGRKAVSREKLALVIPTLHEARNLATLLERVRGVLQSLAIDWEVIVVDDDSGDGTDRIVAAIAQQDPRIRLVVRRGERGLSGAILYGWRHTDATILGAMDADGQHPPEALPGLIASLVEGHDLAIASRYAKGARCRGNPVRRLASMAAILAARPVQIPAFRVRDPLSGFFFVRRHCVEKVFFQTAGFKLLLEILVRGRVRNLDEVPFEFGKRETGRSKLTVRVAWDYLLLLARLFREKYGFIRVAQQAHGD
jgi:dolichol-phosphate mannosyltransferase